MANMTEAKAREIMKHSKIGEEHFKKNWAYAFHPIPEYYWTAKSYLQGLEHERKRAEGLVVCIEAVLKSRSIDKERIRIALDKYQENK